MQSSGESLYNVNKHLLTYFLCVCFSITKIFKKCIKIRDVKKAEATFFSPLSRKPARVYQQKRRKPQCHFPQSYLFVSFYWTGKLSRNVLPEVPVCRTEKRDRAAIWQKEKSFMVSINGSFCFCQFSVKCLIAREWN